MVNNRSTQSSGVQALILDLQNQSSFRMIENLSGQASWMSRGEGDLVSVKGAEEFLFDFGGEYISTVQWAVVDPSTVRAIESFHVNGDGAIEDSNCDSVGICRRGK